MVTDGFSPPHSFSKIETAVAFLFYLDKQCDIVVLETGLGGSLDATNVVTTTLVAVFTSISMDHMGILGDSREQIALAKAGIIKDRCYVISAKQPAEVMKILRQAALLRKSKAFLTADISRAKNIKYGVTKQHFSYDKYKKSGDYDVRTVPR